MRRKKRFRIQQLTGLDVLRVFPFFPTWPCTPHAGPDQGHDRASKEARFGLGLPRLRVLFRWMVILTCYSYLGCIV